MKTAISVPDSTFDEASRRAQELGISRSEFFSTAARKYLDELSQETLTHQIDHALELATVDDSSDAAAATGRRRLRAGDAW